MSTSSSRTGSSGSGTSRVRQFRSSDVMSGTPMVLGKNQTSWFLCFATPYHQTSARAWECLNLLQLHNPQTFLPPTEYHHHPQFLVRNERVLEHLLDLRDEHGEPPVMLTGKRIGRSLVVEVPLTQTEYIHACSRCGKWEALNAPRFRKCSGCNQRCYCSERCQIKDWRTALHKGDCKLLREGREQDVELRRQTHDNHWDRTAQLKNPDYDFSVALKVRDWEFVTYGVRTPLRHMNIKKAVEKQTKQVTFLEKR